MKQRTLDELGPEERRRGPPPACGRPTRRPYMASALLALDPVVVDQSEDPPQHRLRPRALPVDLAWHVYLDPEVLSRLDVPTMGFWLIHQVSHLLRHHGERSMPGGVRPRRSHRVRERDADQRALEPGRPMPRSTTTWSLATRRRPTARSRPTPWACPMAGPPSSTGMPSGRRARGSPGHSPGCCPSRRTADCGSGCDGQDRPWDSGASGLGDAAQKLLEREVAHEIREHQRRWGSTPAGWQRWADRDPRADGALAAGAGCRRPARRGRCGRSGRLQLPQAVAAILGAPATSSCRVCASRCPRWPWSWTPRAA